MLVRQVYQPELFRHEFFDLLVALYDKSERGKLTGAVAHDARLVNDFSEVEGLEPREGRSNSQVDLLSDVNCIG